MFTIKKLDYQDQSKIKEFIESHNSVGEQTLNEIQKNNFSILNLNKIDNIIQRYIPQEGNHLINDRQATAVFDQNGDIIVIALSRQFTVYPVWTLAMIVSNPKHTSRQVAKSVELLTKWLIEYYESEHLYDFWCTIPLKKYITYERFHKYFPGRYTLTVEAVCEKGSRPPYQFYWTLLGGTLPEYDIALIKWTLHPDFRLTKTFKQLYASI
jgi:hypothetical protein